MMLHSALKPRYNTHGYAINMPRPKQLAADMRTYLRALYGREATGVLCECCNPTVKTLRVSSSTQNLY